MFRATVFILLTGLFAFGETQSGTVVSGGQAIPGATVTATCGSDKITTVTDDAGRFQIGGLPASPCSFSVGMFGFSAAPREATASATPLTFDLQLQTRATLPGEQNAAPGGGRGRGGVGRGGFGRQGGANAGNGAPGSNAPSAGQQAANGTPNAGGNAAAGTPGAAPGGQGRGFGRGFGRGQNAQAANGQQGQANGNQGFQSLSLQGNGENQIDSDIAPGDAVDTSGANQAFSISGSLSQGVQAQAGDNFGLGPGGFGGRGGFNNPGGAGGNLFAQNGGQDNGGFGGPGGGGPGGGGPGGGFGGGGGRGGGGRGGGGFGGRGGGRGGPNRNVQFGNRINRNRRQQFQGNAYYTIGNSVLNARPYSFTSPTSLDGAEVPKAAYANNRFGFSGGGPLTIPKLYDGSKTFWFVNYTGVRSKTGFDNASTVPTLAERSGDFSALLGTTTILQPGTTTPFPGNVIPTSLLNPAALGLLNYIPAPNSPGLRNNYQLIGANPSNNDNLQVRINQTLTSKDGVDVNFSYQHRDSDTIQPFGFVDPTSGYGVSGQLTYRRTISRNLINSATWNFSRNLNETLSSFSYGPNIEGNLGITGVSPSAEQFGPPTISFTNFTSLSDATPSSTRVQTSAYNEQLIWLKGKHNITFGVGAQRRQNNTASDSNARGSFNFNGVETGYDFADFLIGMPYQTSVVTYENNNDARYLRETTLSSFVTDDFRWKSNLTINGGLRWEYFGPYTEKYNQMANLDIAPGLNAVSVVLPGQTGPYSGPFGDGFIKPDYKLFSPRIGLAWKPFKARQLRVSAGYGIYYNGGAYGSIAQRLVGQPPFATTTQVFQSVATPLTLENGFPVEESDLIANTFAVNKNYHPGYAQQWTASIQQTFARSYTINVGYSGTKGTDLDVLTLPNRSPLGTPQLLVQSSLLIPNAGEFTYDNSVGNSIYNALQVQLQKRMSNHMSYQILYTFSKAIDDSSTLGGGPVLIPNDISAERALSPTDQRHQLRMQYQFQSPVANTRTGFRANILRGWTLAGTLTATSGTPFTATINGDSSGTGYTGQARAEATGLPVSSGSGYFNPAAFTVPATGTFGDAGRDTIPGIPRFALNASFFRSFQVDEKRRIEFRIDSTNPINHVAITSINTTIGSIQEGLPQNAGAMRSVTATVRVRF